MTEFPTLTPDSQVSGSTYHHRVYSALSVDGKKAELAVDNLLQVCIKGHPGELRLVNKVRRHCVHNPKCLSF